MTQVSFTSAHELENQIIHEFRVEKAGDEPQVHIVASLAHNTLGSIEQNTAQFTPANSQYFAGAYIEGMGLYMPTLDFW